MNYFRSQDDQLKQVEKQGKPRFKVPGVYERAYWFDGNQNPMTMQRCDGLFRYYLIYQYHVSGFTIKGFYAATR